MHHLDLGEGTEGLEASSLELIHGVVDQLLLLFVKVILGYGDDVVGVEFRSIIHLAAIAGRFDFDRVDIEVHVVVDVADVSHLACQEVC